MGDMTVNITVAPEIGMNQKTTREVRVEGGDTVAKLKQRICERYGNPPELQIIKRTVHGQPLQDDEKLVFPTDKTLHLTLENKLKVLTYNVHCGIGTDSSYDLERLGRVIAATEADVVGLQEIECNTVTGKARNWSACHQDDQPRILGKLAGLPHTCFVGPTNPNY